MSPSLLEIGVALGLYVVAVVVVGLVATRRASGSPEEYFLAGRRLGTLVLFMAVFGTNATSFVLVGVPGQAYHDGVGTFGLNAPIIALGIPLTFYWIGLPARRMAQRLGALTPAELYARRFGSPSVGLVLFAFYTLYTLPYMVIAVKGSALTLASMTDGFVAESVAGACVILVALSYTLLGGMRATAWTNVLQGTLFLVFMVSAFFVLARALGGLDAATGAVRAHDPALLALPRQGGPPLFEPRQWTSWGLAISLTVIGFPHMLVRLLAARDEHALKGLCRLYPVALVALWLPAVMIGVWGAAAIPGLEGRASDEIFSLMAARYLPSWMGAVALLAVIAAVMSTLDAQILTLSSMLVRDVLDRMRPGSDDVLAGRLFAVLLALGVYVLSLSWGASVFEMARVSFSGYVTLTPTLLFGVRWRRFTAPAAIASIVVGNLVLLAGWRADFDTLGFLPVFWALAAALVTAVVTALLTRPPDAARTRAAFAEGPSRARAH